VQGEITDVLAKERFWEYQVNFFCGDPALYSEEALTETAIALPSTVVPYAGTFAGLPILEFTISGVGADAQVTFSNSAAPAGYPDFVVRPTENGVYAAYTSREDVALRERVIKDGTDDRTRIRRGAWLKLYPGATNTITVSTSGTVTVSNVSVSWRPRYL
jgi:hypothetical protein